MTGSRILKSSKAMNSRKPVRPSSIPFVLLLSCFFLSGAAGLMYEVLWVRMIDKVIGSAPFAVATVLSVFMGGLALGSFLAGRVIDRVTSKRKLLSLYGWLEFAIGVYAMLLPLIITALEPLYRVAYNNLFSHFWLYQVFTFLGCLLLLLLPTSLMGVTLPVLCRFYVTHLDHLGTRTGRLYGVNTFGAALGCVLCGFVLISRLGVWGTLLVAVLINFFIGASCLLVSTRRAGFLVLEVVPSRRGETGCKSKSPAAFYDAKTAWALRMFAVSGCSAMAYQVFWTRLLGLLLGPTTYSFTLVVSTFIIGLAAGSILFGRLADRTRNVFLMLALTQILAAVFALAVSQFLGNSQFFFSKLISTFQESFGTMTAVQSVTLFAVLLGPTVFLGASFPLVTRIYARSLPLLGGTIGTAYAINTVGAIVGSFVAGFILIPVVGKENGLRLVIALQFVIALAALIRVGLEPRMKSVLWVAGTSMTVLGALLLSHYPSWDRNVLSRGWYRNFRDIQNDLDRATWLDALFRGPAFLARERKGLEVVFYGDGIGGFTTVEKETTSLGIDEYALYNSGKPDASSHGDRSTQTLSGHLPLLFHPNPEKVMVLGLASGMTPGEVLHHPVKQLDVLEINEQVVEACRLFFTPWNNGCLSNPRVRLIVQDGRNHLALTREKYDVIISEPSNPWMSGLANLYTLDFFRLVRARLKDGGIFAQWIQSYEMDWDTFALLGRSFREAFPEGVLMKTGPGDYLLIGFPDRKNLDWKLAEKNIEYARKSTNASFPDFGFLLHMLITEDLQKLFGTGPLHTDDRPRLEFSAPRQLHERNTRLDEAIAARRRLSPETRNLLEVKSNLNTLLDLVEFAASANVPLFSVLNQEDLSASGRDRYMNIVRSYCSRVLVPSFHIFSEPEAKRECAAIQVNGMRRRLALDDSRPDDHYNLSLALIAAGQQEEALRELRITVSLDPFHEDAHTAMGLLLAESGKMEEAAGIFARVAEISPRDARAYTNMGIAEARLGNRGEAIRHFSTALRLAPDSLAALNELGLALMEEGKIDEAIGNFSAALRVDSQDAESHNNLATALYRKGELERAARHFSEALRISPRNRNVRYNLERVTSMLRSGREDQVRPSVGPQLIDSSF